MKYTINRITRKYTVDQIKGFLMYICVVASVLLAYAINWLKQEDPADERIGYESGRYERD